MTPFAWSGLLTLISSTCAAILVLVKTPHIFTNRLWAYFNLAIAIWGLGAFKIASTHDFQTALIWMKIAHVGIILIPVLFLHFANSFFENKNRTVVIASYLLALFYLFLLVTNHLVVRMELIFNSFYYPAYPSFLYVLFFLLWGLSVFYTYFLAYSNFQQTTSEIKRNQIKYFFLATTTGYIGGITNFFPVFDIHIYPYGNFLVALFPITMTCVILKYNLMDMTIVIRRSLIYSSLVTIITLIFLIVVLISEHFFHGVMRYHSVAFSILTASIIALIFSPLKNRIQNLVDRAFFKATPIEMAHQNEKLKAIATLASGLAHEIKNPLTTLKVFSEYIPHKKNDPEFMRQYETIVPAEIERINTLVSDLLAFAKPSSPQMHAVNPEDILNNLLIMLEQKFKSSDLKIVVRFQAGTLIQADPNQLKQVFLNLILNAMDATPAGGKLTLDTYISEATPLQYVISIADTGTGISPEDIKHIFDPFFTKKEKGTGLGLSITQGIIEKHGGRITVESKLQEGTTFKIFLPAN
jgi:signal transduction histidine kinase